MTPTEGSPSQGLGLGSYDEEGQQYGDEVVQAYSMGQPQPTVSTSSYGYATTPAANVNPTPRAQQFYGAASPAPTTMTQGGITLSNDQFQQLLGAFQLSTQQPVQPSTKQPAVARPPRVGGTVNLHGYWTGFGLNGNGDEPRTTDCMREYFDTGIKAFVAMGEVHKRCHGGLNSTSDAPQFSQTHEKDANKFFSCVQALATFCEDHGMEGVFTIVLTNSTKVNLFKRPAFADEQMITKWIDDLTNVGVVADATGKRHPVCRFDKLNLRLSGQAVLNSCSESLRKAIERAIPDEAQRVGPLVYYHVIQRVPTNFGGNQGSSGAQ